MILRFTRDTQSSMLTASFCECLCRTDNYIGHIHILKNPADMLNYNAPYCGLLQRESKVTQFIDTIRVTK